MMIRRFFHETIRTGWLSSGAAILIVAFAMSVAAGPRGSGERSTAGITDLEVNWWTIDGGGVMRSTGAEFELSATIGQPDAGMIKGGDFTLTGGFWFPVVAGDGNGDGVVNLVDYDVFEGCLAGPGGGSPDDLCSSFDTDSSGAVDLRDFAVVQTTFTAP